MTNDKYFGHSANARIDPKIKAIESLFEFGYSYYFKALEYLMSQGGELEVNKYFWGTLKAEINAPTVEETQHFVAECKSDEISLFYELERNGKKFLRSKGLDQRIEIIERKSNLAKESANVRWKNKGENKKPKKIILEESSDSMLIAKRIWNEFAKPAGGREPNFQSWAREVGLILGRDEYSIDYVMKTLDAIAKHEGSDGFKWGNVIRSPSKLRKQMVAGMVNPNLSTGKNTRQGVKATPGKYSKVAQKI